MDCCNNKVNPEEEDEVEDPLEDRSCTDVICLLIFIAFLIGMIFAFGYGILVGNPNRIIRGYDVAGDVCGQTNREESNIPRSGKNLESQKLLFIDVEKTSMIYMSEASSAVTGGQQSNKTSRIEICLAGTATGRRKRLANYKSYIEGIKEGVYKVQNSEVNFSGKLLTDDNITIIDLQELNGEKRIWRTRRASSGGNNTQNINDMLKSLLNRHDAVNLMSGGGFCRHCVEACPSDYEQFLTKCIPKGMESTTGNLLKSSGVNDFFLEVVTDIEHSLNEIILICGIAVVLSLIVTALFRFFAKFIVYLIIALVVLAAVGGTIALWVIYYLNDKKYKDYTSSVQNSNSTEGSAVKERQAELESDRNLFLAIAIIATLLLVILILILLVLRKRIALVVQLFTEAGAAIKAMPLILLTPLVTVVVQICILALWSYATLWIESGGTPEIDETTKFVIYKKDSILLGIRWYHLFGLFWLIQFCVAFQHLFLAGSIAGWYFSTDKGSVGHSTLVMALYRVLRYHLGTVAFGSFIIALIQFIRVILRQVEKKVKSMKKSEAGEVLAIPVIICLKVSQCCLYCFEKCIKYLNINAYIITAIYGFNFCRAAFKAFKLLASNAIRVAAINSVGTFVLFLGKIVIVVATGFIGYEIMQLKLEKIYIKHYWAPILIGIVFAAIVAHSFISVYHMAIDTIFLCFCEDCEKNDGVNKPYYMSRGLMKFAENSDKALAALENKEAAKTKLIEAESMPDVDD